MKNLKNVIVIVTCFIMMLTLSAANAQDKAAALKESTPVQRTTLQTALMKNKLQLDSIQTTKVQAINLKYAEKMQPLLNGDEGKFKRLRDMASIQKAKDADLKAVFTKDQEKQYEAMKEEIKGKLKDLKNDKQ